MESIDEDFDHYDWTVLDSLASVTLEVWLSQEEYQELLQYVEVVTR